MISPVINLYRTKEEAFYFKDSPINQFYRFCGVHLLPNNSISYVQVTDTPDGIELEDWTVKAISLCDNEETDITSSFMVEELTNSLNGNPQVIWSLTNINADYGIRLVYLQVTQTLGETFYSTPFVLSDFQSELTTQFHYKDKRTETLQSIGFKTWFRQEFEQTELTTYYETSTQTTVTQAVKVNDIEIHKTETMSLMELKKLAMVLRSPYLYANLERVHLFEAVSFPTVKGDENFGSLEFKLSMSKNDKLSL